MQNNCLVKLFVKSFIREMVIRLIVILNRWCVQQDNDQLAKSAVSCLENLVLTNRPKMNRETEHTVLNFLSDVITGKLIYFYNKIKFVI